MLIEVSVLLSIFIISFYVWLTWNYDYWKKLEIPYVEPLLLFGNLKDFLLFKKCKAIVYDELYRESKVPAIGIFTPRNPQLLIRDISLAKTIFINEFHSFSDNDAFINPSDFFHSNHLFFMSGQKWKTSRSKLSPALTASKLKMYMPQMMTTSRDMIDYINENLDKEFEAKQLSELYTISLTMGCVFGSSVHSFNDAQLNCRKVMNNFTKSRWTRFKFSLGCLFPLFRRFFHIGITSKKFYEFYTGVVREAVIYRKSNKVRRNDFLQHILDFSGKDGSPECSIHDITGYTMNVMVDAAETTSIVLSHVIDCLLRYHDVRKKLVEEIDKKICSLDDITYDNLNAIPYLNAFISEVLRMRPVLPIIERLCNQECKISFEGKKYAFQKGDKVAISIYSLQMDPKYFPNPQEFRPERFLDFHDHPGYWPFGFGPRTCLGKVFGQMEIKVFLCALLLCFEIVPARELSSVQFDPKSIFTLSITSALYFKVKQR